jgi:plasmid stabilization system protein ParE
VKVVLRRAAERDIEQAALWYEQQRPGLGTDFMNAVRHSVSGISQNPEAYPVIVNQIRRALLRGFPYGLFYLVEGERLVVIGCFHARQSPKRWTTRG